MVKSRVTLEAVAKKSGVSVTTASMILSGRADLTFAKSTVRKVRDAAAALGYEDRRKKRGDTFALGKVLIVCPNVINPYYSTMVQAIEQAAYPYDCATVIQTTFRDADTEARLLKEFASSALGGLIFTMMPQCVELVEKVSRLKPLVVIGDRKVSLDVDTVELNNYEAGLMLGRHLTSLGHRHAAYISSPLNEANSARVLRLNGVKAAFAEANGSITVKSAEVSPEQELGNISIEHAIGYELAEKCLSDPQITALLAVNDMVAYGVLDALAAHGLSVPEDYSVCGFDNIFPSRFLPVGLTTVEHYLVEKARYAFEILHARMRGSQNAPNVTRIEFGHKLVCRPSTGAPRQTGSKNG